MTDVEFRERAMLMLRRNEGYRNRVYKDTEGHLTVGIGHKLPKDSKLKLKDYVNDKTIERMFIEDFNKFYEKTKTIPGYKNFTTQQQMALLDLTFNMGFGWTNKFKNAYSYIKKAAKSTSNIDQITNWRMAAAELQYRDPHKDNFENTKYWGQVGSRAQRNVDRFNNMLSPEEGEWDVAAREL